MNIDTDYISFIRSTSVWEVLSTHPFSILPPFLYLLEIIKDVVQLIILVHVLGGYEYVFIHWTSFSSVVSREKIHFIEINSFQLSIHGYPHVDHLGNLVHIIVNPNTNSYCKLYKIG